MNMKNLIICVALIALALPTWAYDFTVGGLAYEIDDDGVSVLVVPMNDMSSADAAYTSLTGTVNIPSSVKYSGKTYTVSIIGGSAFKGCTGITAVNFPNTLTEIYSSAFSYVSKRV